MGTAWPRISACWRVSSRASTSRSAAPPLMPENTARMSASSSSRQVTRVPIWLITSGSMPLGRWSTMSSVTLYLRSSRAMVPKIVWRATAGSRNLCASSMVMTSGRGSSRLAAQRRLFAPHVVGVDAAGDIVGHQDDRPPGCCRSARTPGSRWCPVQIVQDLAHRVVGRLRLQKVEAPEHAQLALDGPQRAAVDVPRSSACPGLPADRPRPAGGRSSAAPAAGAGSRARPPARRKGPSDWRGYPRPRARSGRSRCARCSPPCCPAAGADSSSSVKTVTCPWERAAAAP